MKKLNIMKNILYTLALLVSFSSFGQEITFDELMTINSTDSFKRVVIENGYEFKDIISKSKN